MTTPATAQPVPGFFESVAWEATFLDRDQATTRRSQAAREDSAGYAPMSLQSLPTLGGTPTAAGSGLAITGGLPDYWAGQASGRVAAPTYHLPDSDPPAPAATRPPLALGGTDARSLGADASRGGAAAADAAILATRGAYGRAVGTLSPWAGTPTWVAALGSGEHDAPAAGGVAAVAPAGPPGISGVPIVRAAPPLVTAVPEPSLVALTAGGLFALGGGTAAARRRRRTA